MKSLFNIFRKNKKTYENIFIHVPKTGGSSFVGLLQETTNEHTAIKTHLVDQIQQTKIIHIDFKQINRTIKDTNIFNLKTYKDYHFYNIFLLVRNPAERLLSEYNFQYHILDGKNANPSAAIITKLSKIPHKFEDYIAYNEVQDYQCKFLLGRPLLDKNPIQEDEFQGLIHIIDALNIHCFLTENYNDFINSFANISKMNLHTKFVKRKQTPKHLKQKISNDLLIEIKKRNEYDYKLYEYVSNKNINNTKDKIKYQIEETDSFII